MQEFCPLCSKNDAKTKIKAYQLNLQEAILMCSAETCTWPVGYQEVKFVNRPVGKEWSKNWDKSISKYLKNEDDLLFELSVYTPPQTPGTEAVCKETTNTCTSSTLFTEKISASMPMLIDDVHKSQDNISTLSKPHKLSIDNNNINSSISMKPKLLTSKLVKYKLEQIPTKGYKLIKSNENSDDKQLTDSTNNSTSLVSNSLTIKNNNLNNISFEINNIKNKQKSGLKLINRKKLKICPYEKFDFNDLRKAKSTNENKECTVESNCKDKTKEQSQECVKVLTKSMDECSFDKYDFNEILNSSSTIVENHYNNVTFDEVNAINCSNNDRTDYKANVINCNNSSQIDYESLLASTNSSKDSGVDRDILNGELDLEDLLTAFSAEISESVKSDLNDSDDCKWIKSLFE